MLSNENESADQTGDTVAVDVNMLSKSEESIFVASQWQLMWWRFRKHKPAMVGLVIVVLLYAVAIFPEFFSTYDPERTSTERILTKPTVVHFYDPETGFSLRPFVYGITRDRNPETLRYIYGEDRSLQYPLRFFVRGYQYELWGQWPSDLHFVGFAEEGGEAYFFGADRLGRDVYSRVVFSSRISMSIGLIGVLMSLVLGILLGGISGYFAGSIDLVIQRVIEFIRSIPTIPLWMSLAAAVPQDWPPLRVYFVITILLSLIAWTSLARVVRGKFLALREEDFVMAARLAGSSQMRIIWRHMVPSFLSHIIASITLSIPQMILSETSLSFLGLGLRPPVISWGVMLRDAQNVQSVALAPWLLSPGAIIVVTVLAFNFMGDGLRDAADPYSR